MAYIGKAPVNGFHSKQQLTGDGSTVTFTLDYTVASESSIIVSVGGVLQEPAVAFNLAQGGTKITFTEAPASTDRVYIQFLGQAVVQNLLDVNGAEFILDANADTSLTADTDDEIDIKIGGTDRSTIKATGFHNLDNIKFVAGTGDDMQMYHDGTNSYLTNLTGALKLATETSGIAVTIGHTTSEVTIADNATVAGNLTVTGTLTQTGSQTFDGGIDVDNFNINGTTIALSSGDMTLDSAGDIILDADGGDVFFKDAGTTFGSATNTSGNLIIKSGTTTALTFSGANVTAAGTITGNLTGNVTGTADVATVATTVTITDNEATNENNAVIFTAGGDVDGGNIGLESDGDLTYNPSTGTLNVPNISVTGTQTIVNSVTMNASNAVIFEGATADAYETTLSTVDATADITINLPNVAGTLPVLAVASTTAITSTPEELNILDDATVTTAELNLIDGGTARGTTAVATGDGILINDGGTMRMTNVDTVSTYFSSHNVGGGNIVTTGALNSGTITSGFGTINNGSSTITTTGAVATGAITAGGNIIIPDAGNIGSASDTDAIAIASNGVVTFSQIPVLPANSIDSDQYVDGSIDTAHIADAQVTLAKTTGLVGKQTIWVPANAMTPTASNGCSILTTVETTSGRPDMNVLDFDKDSDEFAQFSVAFPKSWNAGTITFQFFWSGIAATTGVAMSLEGVSFADNDSIDTAYGTAVVVQDDAQSAVEELLVSAESGAVTIAGSPGDNELCYFRVGRDVSDGNDDMAGDARLHGIKIFYTTDALNDA